MAPPLKIMTWLWKQKTNKHAYNAEKVNVWAAMMRRNVTIPHTLACVTNTPEGIDSSVEIIPLPNDFDSVVCNNWSERAGAPQCYRRLTMFASDAAQRFGADRWISMDLDVIVCGNLDSILTVREPLKFYRGTSGSRPYNGSMMYITAGVRPHVYDRFSQEGAAHARARYIGSDQAWISYALGWTEATWSEKEGVYFYTKGFSSRYCRGSNMNVPAGMKLLFFPGVPKPWDMLQFEFVREHWRINEPFLPPKKKGIVIPQETPFTSRPFYPTPSGKSRKSGKYVKPMPAKPVFTAHKLNSLWSFDGPKGWGQHFQCAARSLGKPCALFTDVAQVPNGSRAWVRLDQQGSWRQKTKAIVAELQAREIKTLATEQDARWYDDKVEQHSALEPWLPKTRVIKNLQDALSVAQTLRYPIVSKASEGASSVNIRLLKNVKEAEAEAIRAFGKGLVLSHERVQRGYVYWQDLIPDCSVDYRVIITGRLVFGIVRNVREGDFRASGSGSFRVSQMKTEQERQAAKLCIDVAKALKTQWVAFDVVFDAKQKPYIIEMSSSWLAKAYDSCPLFDFNLNPAKGNFMQEAVNLLCKM